MIDQTLQIYHFLTEVLVVGVKRHLRDFVLEIVEVAFGKQVLEVELLLWALKFCDGITVLVSLLSGSLSESQARVSGWLKEGLKPHDARVSCVEVVLALLALFFHLINDVRSI